MAKDLGAEQPGRASCVLYYPPSMSPEDLLCFVELRPFTQAWHDLGLSDDDLQALQIVIMAAPDMPAVIPATGGLRKFRFAPPKWRTGKRGALRVCYAYFAEFGVVLLVLIYPKNRKDNLTANERNTIRKLLARIHKELSARPCK